MERACDMSYVLKAIDDLMPAPYNPRKITPDALAGLADSVTEYGDLSGIVWNARTSRIVAGHQRLEALKQRHGAALSFDAATGRPDALPAIVTPDGERFVVRVVDWPEEKEQLANIAANSPDIQGAFVEDKLGAMLKDLKAKGAELKKSGLMKGRLEKLLGTGCRPVDDPGAQMDRAAELQSKWQTARGQVWEIPSASTAGRSHRLMCGDSINADDVALLMGHNTAACAVFDPEWDHAPGVALPPDRIVFTDGYRAADSIRMHGIPRWVFIWDCVSSWYVPGHPLRRMKIALWYGTASYNENGSHYGNSGDAKTVTNSRGTYEFVPDPRGKHLSDLFQSPITKEHAQGESHAKPVDWIRCLIADCMPVGLIYDPFIGSGTTMVAAEQLGRICYGMEIEPKYVAVVLQRMQDMGLVPVLLENEADAHPDA